MVEPKDVTIIDKSKLPVTKLVGAYTFLRDMGKALLKDQAIQIKSSDATEVKKLQNRWRAYFKEKAHTMREVQPDGKTTLYLWLS